jgi:hypothetical protein
MFIFSSIWPDEMLQICSHVCLACARAFYMYCALAVRCRLVLLSSRKSRAGAVLAMWRTAFGIFASLNWIIISSCLAEEPVCLLKCLVVIIF